MPLGCTFYPCILEFYENEENKKAFEEWLEEKKRVKQKSTCPVKGGCFCCEMRFENENVYRLRPYCGGVIAYRLIFWVPSHKMLCQISTNVSPISILLIRIILLVWHTAFSTPERVCGIYHHQTQMHIFQRDHCNHRYQDYFVYIHMFVFRYPYHSKGHQMELCA